MNRPNLQPLISTPLRIAAAIAMVAAVATAWSTAEDASHQAVIVASDAISRTHVVLPSVVVVGKRDAATPSARPAV